MAAVTISRSKDRLIAVKEVSAARSGEIEREAEMLKRLDHPGVVRFVDLVDTEDGGRALHTEFVSSDTWATRPLTDPADRAAGAAALAAVVADLHQMGVAHMQLTPAHVLHGDDDRPVLCGLSLAGEATADNRHADMAALADLCHDPSLERGTLATKLASLADAARTGTLDARDLARRLDLLVAKKPAAADSIRAVSGGIADRVTGRSGRRILLAAGAAAVVVVGHRGPRILEPEPAAGGGVSPGVIGRGLSGRSFDDRSQPRRHQRRHRSGPGFRAEHRPAAAPAVSQRRQRRGVGAGRRRCARPRRAPLRSRRHRRFRDHGRLGLRRPGHRRHCASQHRRRGAVRLVARPRPDHLGACALEPALPHWRSDRGQRLL